MVGHLGYTPQTHEGDRRVFGDRFEEAQEVLIGALSLQEAGAVALVLECVPERVAEAITGVLRIPTIGIGAGRSCDGQVLVTPDLLGFNPFQFRFVKKYAELRSEAEQAFSTYVAEVKSGAFPGAEHRFRIRRDELEKFRASLPHISGEPE